MCLGTRDFSERAFVEVSMHPWSQCQNYTKTVYLCTHDLSVNISIKNTGMCIHEAWYSVGVIHQKPTLRYRAAQWHSRCAFAWIPSINSLARRSTIKTQQEHLQLFQLGDCRVLFLLPGEKRFDGIQGELLAQADLRWRCCSCACMRRQVWFISLLCKDALVEFVCIPNPFA